MKETPEQLHRIEVLIGGLLRWGVLTSASIVAFGAVLYMWHNGSHRADYGTFRGGTSESVSIPGVFHGVARLDGAAIIQLGLLVLIATPVARVVFSLIAFLHERDWLYTVFTSIVLGVLAYSLLS